MSKQNDEQEDNDKGTESFMKVDVDETSSFPVPATFPVPAALCSQKTESDISERPSHTTKCPTAPSHDGTTQNIEILSTSKSKQSTVKSADRQSTHLLPYREPEWGGVCSAPYMFEVIKNGTVIDTLELTKKSFYVFGRLPACDVTMEHPSLSRFHAVVQYCALSNSRHRQGWYLYDLESTHGTFLNKKKIDARQYHHIGVGHVIKFAGSTRLHVLQGPADEDDSIDIERIKKMTKRKATENEDDSKDDNIGDDGKETSEEDGKSSGCLWGMADDAVDTDTINPFSLSEPQHEDLYIDDPKKALKGYFEREGFDQPEYIAEEMSYGKHSCKVELPVDTTAGGVCWAEASVTGKKREAVVACALEACRILDRHGLLRKATHESRKRKEKNWADEDYYGSDEDVYFDRTGDIEERRQARMKRFSKKTRIAETYQTLTKQFETVQKELQEKKELLKEDTACRTKNETDEPDALEAYMSSIKAGAMDAKSKMQLKQQLFKLKKEESRLERLIRIAQPSQLPNLSKAGLPLFGKRKTGSPRITESKPPLRKDKETGDESSAEEEEEEEEEETKKVEVTEVANEAAIITGDFIKPDLSAKESFTMSPERLKDNSIEHCKPGSGDDAIVEEEIENSLEKTISSVVEKVKKDQNIGPSSPCTIGANDTSVTLSQVNPTPTLQMPKSKNLSSDMKEDKLRWQKEGNEDKPRKADGRQRRKKFKSTDDKEPLSVDSKVDMWLPPAGQTGDGKTSLNAKFGY